MKMTDRQKELNEEEEVLNLLKKSEISLHIDSYDAIFSDFDPRPYSERALSDDFLIEAKKASKDKGGSIELNLLIHAKARNPYNEALIKKRLKEHFRKHYHLLLEEKKKYTNTGIFMVLLGIFFMFSATLILFNQLDYNLMNTFLVVLLEPAGWFSFWEGLRMVLFDKNSHKEDLEFYQKMANSEINFLAY